MLSIYAKKERNGPPSKVQVGTAKYEDTHPATVLPFLLVQNMWAKGNYRKWYNANDAYKSSAVVWGIKWLFQELTAIKVIDVVLSSDILFPGRGMYVSGWAWSPALTVPEMSYRVSKRG